MTAQNLPDTDPPPPPPPARGIALKLRGIRKIFDGGVEAVANIDLQIPAGQFVAILGPSGCGKSTLLRIVAGLEEPTDGCVTFDAGFDRRAIAYVFQDAHLLPWRNVLRNVELPLELSAMEAGRRRTEAEQALQQVGLGDVLKRYPAQLSGGMRMRVSLARALVTRPRLLLLDEPFAALDEITRQKLDEQLRNLWIAHQMTVLFVTHSTAEATFLADRAVVLSRRPGRVVEDLTIDLPVERNDASRTQSRFVELGRQMFQALQRGGA